MTQLEEYRIRRLIPQLRKLAKAYPMKTLENIIRNLDDRLEHYKPKKQKT
jgi:hypothetical protein